MEKVKAIIGVSILPMAWTMLVRALGETRIEIKDSAACYHTYSHCMGIFVDELSVDKFERETDKFIGGSTRWSLMPFAIDHKTFQK